MKKFYLKDVELRNDEEFVKPKFFSDTVFVYFGFQQDSIDDELASFDLNIISYDYLYDFVERLGGLFLKESLLLKKYDLDEISSLVEDKYFKDNKDEKFLVDTHEEHFDEDWDEIEEDMLAGIEEMKHSKSYIKTMKITSNIDFDKENFDEKLKIVVVIFDREKDVTEDYYLYIRSTQNLKQEDQKEKLITKSYFLDSYDEDKIQKLLKEIEKECKFNTGIDDIKETLISYFISATKL